MIQQFFIEQGEWAWLILGLLLLSLELLAPGTMFLWFGLAALIVGLIGFFVELSWQSAFILFGLLSLISVLVGRYILKRMAPTASDQPMLNARAKALVGQVYILDAPIENGQGRVKVNDSYWRVAGSDVAAGQKVRVVGSNGTVLDVVPV
nr:NfeD family protein [uncultured Cohaesibacter sp.]